MELTKNHKILITSLSGALYSCSLVTTPLLEAGKTRIVEWGKKVRELKAVTWTGGSLMSAGKCTLKSQFYRN
jgi:hypothetical protein